MKPSLEKICACGFELRYFTEKQLKSNEWSHLQSKNHRRRMGIKDPWILERSSVQSDRLKSSASVSRAELERWGFYLESD